MNKKLQKKHIILIFSLLLLFVSIVNYINYYAPKNKVLDYMSLSTKKQKEVKELNKSLMLRKNDQTTSDDEDVNLDEDNNIQIKTSKPSGEYDNDDILYGDNYLKYAANSSGKIVKWNKKNIKVYIYNSNYNDVLAKAFSKYNKTYSEYFQFIKASSPNTADIIVDVVDKFESNDNPNNVFMMGVTNNYFDSTNKNLNMSKIKLLSVNPNTKKPVTKSEMYVTLLHEIGHSLGIVGHSPRASDIMHPVSGANSGTFTSRDRITIKMMYSNINTVVQRETNNTKDAKLKEAVEYAKMSPNHAISWINLGKEYYNNNQKEKSLEAYKKAMAIEPNNPLVYQAMAEGYYTSAKYDTAIKYYSKALSLTKEGSAKVGINNMIGVCYAKKENYDSAYIYFKEAYSARLNDRNLLLNFLASCVATGRKQEALQYINSYKNLGNNISNDAEIQSFLKVIK